MRKRCAAKWRVIEAFRQYAVISPWGERAVSDHEREIMERVLDQLSPAEKTAVQNVYMMAPKEYVNSEKIRYRVKRTAYETFYSESNVYRMLKRARELYEKEREQG